MSLEADLRAFIALDDKVKRLELNRLKNKISELEKKLYLVEQENQRLQAVKPKKKFLFF